MDNLSTTVVLGCTFCDMYADAIRPGLNIVHMDDGAAIPIVRKPLKAHALLPRSEK